MRRAAGAVMLALFACACPNGTSGPTTKGPTVNHCKDALDRFARREFVASAGIPGGCTPDDVAAVLSPVGAPTVGLLGDPKRAVELRHYRIAGWKADVRGWFEDGRLLLLDTDDPVPPGEWRAFVENLGEPDGRLDYRWRLFVLEDAEYVYASRGLAIVVKPDPGLILRLALFAPTTVDAYARELRFQSEPREEE